MRIWQAASSKMPQRLRLRCHKSCQATSYRKKAHRSKMIIKAKRAEEEEQKFVHLPRRAVSLVLRIMHRGSYLVDQADVWHATKTLWKLVKFLRRLQRIRIRVKQLNFIMHISISFGRHYCCVAFDFMFFHLCLLCFTSSPFQCNFYALIVLLTDFFTIFL